MAALYEKTIAGIVRLVVKHTDGVAYGSGFIVGGKGIILTSYHCIEGASGGVVTFYDGTNRLIEGVLAYDIEQDLALVKVDVDGLELHSLLLSLSRPEVGTKVVAIGNPQGFFGTVTGGTITGLYTGSQVGEKFPALRGKMVAGERTEWVLTDAEITVGNTGGPLLDAAGKVVGVNTWSWGKDKKLALIRGFAVAPGKIMELVSRAETTARPLKDVALKEFGKLPTHKMVERHRLQRTGLHFKWDWRVGRLQSRTQVGEAIALARRSLTCQKCEGSGKIEVQAVRDEGPDPLGGRRLRHVPRRVLCPACGGSGHKVTELTYLRLCRMTEAVMRLNTRPMKPDTIHLIHEAARNVFERVAAAREASPSLCTGLPIVALTGDQPTVGKAVVFYGRLLKTFSRAGRKIGLMRMETGRRRPVIVLMPEGCKAAAGNSCLVGGLTAGTVTLNTSEAVYRERGVEAFAVETVSRPADARPRRPSTVPFQPNHN